MNMKIEYDKEADAAYIYIDTEIKEGQIKNTTQISDDIILDFDSSDILLGIEVLNASKHLSKKVLLQEA